MKKRLQEIQALVDGLSLRERVLVFLSGTAVVFLLWNLLMFAPQHAERNALNLQLEAVQQKLGFQAQEASVMARLVNSGVDQGNILKLAELEQQGSALDRALSKTAVSMVPPEDLMNVLEEVLRKSNKLNIKLIRTLPPEEVKLQRVKNAGEMEITGVTSHAVVLKLEGSYFELLDYLRGLEQLPWRMYWNSLKYRVSGYPIGSIELKVSTLTMEEALFEDQ